MVSINLTLELPHPVAKYLPSGENAKSYIQSMTIIKYHNKIIKSINILVRVLPHCWLINIKKNLFIPACFPSNFLISFRYFISSIFNIGLKDPVAIYSPFSENARQLIFAIEC